MRGDGCLRRLRRLKKVANREPSWNCLITTPVRYANAREDKLAMYSLCSRESDVKSSRASVEASWVSITENAMKS